MTIERSDSPVFVPQGRDVATITRRDAAEIGVRLLDDAHTAWLLAERAADQALEEWRSGGVGTRSARYGVYRAAVEREEAAARDLRRLYEIATSYPGQADST